MLRIFALLIFPSVFVHGGYSDEEKIIDSYEILINNSIASANNYTLPTNARQYEGNYYETADSKDFGVFDFIVIGAGAAGAPLAARLSEILTWNVLLIDAGNYGTNFTDVSGLNTYIRYSDFNWGFTTVPQTSACLGMVDNRCAFPRGKAIGGSTVTNGLIYSRGNAKDYDLWSGLVGGGWSYQEVLPYFRKAENQTLNADLLYHGIAGPMTVSYPSPISPQTQAFLDANVELGGNIVEYNGANQFGFSRMELNTNFGKRVTTGTSYVWVNRNRRNLVVLTDSFVTKLLIKDQKVYGVEFTKDGLRSTATASKEVLVCGGVIGSPAILIHSGIGPKDDLQALNITLVKDLPVGRNMYGHATFFGLSFNSNYTSPDTTQRDEIEDFLNGGGRFTIPANFQGIGFFASSYNNRSGTPDLELMMAPSGPTDPIRQKLFNLRDEVYAANWARLNKSTAFEIDVVLLHPKSFGDVKVVSDDPFEYPLINPRPLTDPEDLDIETIYEGVQYVLQLIDTDAFKQFNISLVNYTFPACINTTHLSKDYWFCTIRQITTNVHRPVSTCKMGPEAAGGVVDNAMKVYGVKGLRVCDASVFPFPLSGGPSAPATMLGEKLADMIKLEYLLSIGGIL